MSSVEETRASLENGESSAVGVDSDKSVESEKGVPMDSVASETEGDTTKSNKDEVDSSSQAEVEPDGSEPLPEEEESSASQLPPPEEQEPCLSNELEEGKDKGEEGGGDSIPQNEEPAGDKVEPEVSVPQEGVEDHEADSETLVAEKTADTQPDSKDLTDQDDGGGESKEGSDDDSFATAEGTEDEAEEEGKDEAEEEDKEETEEEDKKEAGKEVGGEGVKHDASEEVEDKTEVGEREDENDKSSDEEGSKEPLRRRRRRGDDSDVSEEGEGEEEDAGRGGTEERDEEEVEEEEEEEEEDPERAGGADDDRGDVAEEGEENEEWTEKEEREKEGEGEEEGEDNPPHVPTVGMFFQHDRRLGDEEGEQEVETPKAIPSRADKVERWGHDLYVEKEQMPRKSWEKERDANYWTERESRGDDQPRSKRGQRLGNFIREDDRARFDSPRGRGGQGRRGRGGGGRGGRGGYRDRYRDDNNEEKEEGDGGDGYRHRDDDRGRRGRGRRGGGGYGHYRNGNEGRESGGWQEEDGDREGEDRLRGRGGERREERRYQGRDRVDRRYDRESYTERKPRERGRQLEDWGEDGEKADTPSRDRDQYGSGSSRGNRGQRRGGGSRGWEERNNNRRDNSNSGGGNWDSTVVSETGTEDWGEGDGSTKVQGNDSEWPTLNQKEDKGQPSPEIATAQGEQTSAASPTQASEGIPSSGGGGGERKETTIFSLSRDKDLVMRYTSKRGKVRGRGQRSSGSSRVGGLGSSGGGGSTSSGTKTRYAPPKPGSGGITVIEPLEQRLQRQDGERDGKDATDGAKTEESSPSGSRRVQTAESAKEKRRPGSGHSPSNKDGGGGQAPTSKPKRYSSQRQKGEADQQQSHPAQQPLPQQLPPPPPPPPQAQVPEPLLGQWAGLMGPGGPGVPGGPVPNVPALPVDPAVYQDLIAQQSKWLEMTAATTGIDLMTLQAMAFQNPILLQQQQQFMWQQPFPPPPPTSAEGPPHPGAVPPPGDGSLLGYPPQLPGMPVPGGLDQNPHYTSPSGLFIPSIPPDQQQRRQHTKQQKPRSQAIPIVSPSVATTAADEGN